MTKSLFDIALMSAVDLPDEQAADGVPEWIHVLPAREGQLETVDARGPYHIRNAEAVIAASMAAGPIHIDQDHATSRAAPRGEPAPARGWITAMEARPNGVWAQVDWTDVGRDLVATRAYRKISPVIRVIKSTGEVTGIREVSLVNNPNLRGLVALNSEETGMGLLEKLVDILGLTDGADEAAVLAAVRAKLQAPEAQSQLDQVAGAIGLEAGTSLQTIVTACQAVRAAGDEGNSEIAALQSRLADLEASGKRRAAEEFVDQSIREGYAIPQGKREIYVDLHVQSPESARAIVGSLPKIGPSATSAVPPERATSPSPGGLSADQRQVCEQMGIDPEEYAKTLADEQEEIA